MTAQSGADSAITMGATLRPSGDSALLVEFEQRIDTRTASRIQSFLAWLEQNSVVGVVEAIPGYCTVLIEYNPVLIGYAQLHEAVSRGLSQPLSQSLLDAQPTSLRRVVVIPVCYGGEFGPDLDEVARLHRMNAEEVIAYHTRPDYDVYFTGFLPSFPFLGGMHREIATPRLDEPRKQVPAGSVGIAGQQTGIYPVASPGGWRIIGRTPLRLFNPDRADPFLLRAGDVLRFRPVTEQEYDKIRNCTA